MLNTFYCAAPIRVFVYGTLKPGEKNYPRYCQGNVKHAQPAIAQGLLYDLCLGYPAMTPGEGWVKGVLLSFEDVSVLAALDELEGYHSDRNPEDNEYERSLIEVFTPDQEPLGESWIYWMPLPTIQRWEGTFIPNGDWSSEALKL